MAANYDNAAWFYDRLSCVVFGSTLMRAQIHFLPLMPPGAAVLVAGGGTGRILEEIAHIHPSGLNITYAEISAEMIAKARSRNAGQNQVEFINAGVETVVGSDQFDVVITPFLLDSLNPELFSRVFMHLHQALKPGGLWLYTDFQLSGRWWQKSLLRAMYTFFRLMGCTDVSGLPAIGQAFVEAGYLATESQTFYGDFIMAKVYKKWPR